MDPNEKYVGRCDDCAGDTYAGTLTTMLRIGLDDEDPPIRTLHDLARLLLTTTDAPLPAGTFVSRDRPRERCALHAEHDKVCEECGEWIVPDDSVGVWVHAPDLGDLAYDLNENHAARPEVL